LSPIYIASFFKVVFATITFGGDAQMTNAPGTPEAQFDVTSHVPNAETIEAMREAERIARDPSAKKYATAEELIAELRAECNAPE
jgi:hypothetical protein